MLGYLTYFDFKDANMTKALKDSYFFSIPESKSFSLLGEKSSSRLHSVEEATRTLST